MNSVRRVALPLVQRRGFSTSPLSFKSKLPDPKMTPGEAAMKDIPVGFGLALIVIL